MSKELIGCGKWIKLEELTYTDKMGKSRKWEMASRVNDLGAVGIFTKLMPSEQVVIIKQFRAPLDGYVLEFPAGLIDDGESHEVAALRELREETGYTGVVKAVYPPVYSSPGLTNESIALVVVEVDESDPINQNVTPNLESSEDIETILVPLKALKDYIISAVEQGIHCDAKLLSFVIHI